MVGRGRAIAVVAVGALALAGCGGSGGGGNGSGGSGGGGNGSGGSGGGRSGSASEPARSGDLTAPSSATTTSSLPSPPSTSVTEVAPALSKLRRSLGLALRKAGPHTGINVYDLNRDETLFTLRADVARPPASVEKLYTTLALLNRLEPNTTLATKVMGEGHLGPKGVWEGNLYLVGGGDPTFGDEAFNRTWELGFGPSAGQLVAQLRGAGIRRVRGRLFGDESLFARTRGGRSSRYQPDLPDYGGELSALTYDHGSTVGGARSPGAFAAHELALTMRAARVKVRAAPLSRRAPSHAQLLATVTSPPLPVLLKLMDVPSDDLFAELLTEQLGARFAHRGTIAAGAGVIAETIAQVYGVHPRIADGSGLDRSNRSSPTQIVTLLRAAWRSPIRTALLDALPTVGVSGTVRRIAVHTAAQGRCLAKTGTLDRVTNLAGYCLARGQRKIAFALFIDGPENWQALPLVGRMMAAIAAY
jgi:serine-type D-Ala-D-Ala carboxypeptidase/endopeptidase (penicillin-binding protein 4)